MMAATTTATTVQAAQPEATELDVAGPHGPLRGTLLEPAAANPTVPGQPVAILVPGSGPTDRDGNSPLGLKAAPYRLLAEALAARGIASLRFDKRGIAGSRDAIPDPNAVTLDDYAADLRTWATALRRRSGAPCVWLVGHSEGGLVALKAAADPAGLCGLVLIATPGRPMGAVLREQFGANPANAPYRAALLDAIAVLEAGRHVDPAALAAPLRPIFAPQVQDYLISAFAFDPAPALANSRLPVLILQGTRDLQVSEADSALLKAALPSATLIRLPGVNHVLKRVPADDRAANLATYADSGLPLAPGVAEAIAAFISVPR
ncbi:alpha/beta hydrolase [Ancylobacter sonchi]